MRILQVLAGAPQGGAETAFVDTCIAMAQAGQAVRVVTRANDLRVPQLKAAGIRVHTLPFGGPIDIYTPYAIARICKKFKPDIIQTWMSRAAQKVPRWSPSMKIPRYLVVSRLGGYYKIKNFRNTDYFTTITPDIQKYLIEKGVKKTHVRHINNFAETEPVNEKFDPCAYGVKSVEKIGISLGRLHESKAFDILIQSVSDVENFHLFIAGEGPDRAALEKQIADLGLQGRVHLLGWRSDRAALLEMADICIFPSRYEPFGTVFVQAWANKIPLVTTDSDGPRQFVKNEIDGLIVPRDDVLALRNAIRRVLQEPELAATMVENGYQRYSGEFTKEKTVADYLSYFREIRTREGLLVEQG